MIPFFIMMIEDDEDREYAQHLYETYRLPMLQIARRMMGSSNDAEDAVMDAFLGLIKHLQKVRALDEGNRRAYITVTVKNSCLMLMRKNNRQPEASLDEIPAVHLADPSPTPDKLVVTQYEHRMRKKAIAQLDDIEQLMLYRKVVERRLDVTLAAEFGCSSKAIRTRYTRLRKKLRTIYEELQKQPE